MDGERDYAKEPAQEGRLKVNIIFREANSKVDALARTDVALEFEFNLYHDELAFVSLVLYWFSSVYLEQFSESIEK
ncbi:hypothetical protein QQP08_017254 [Theobroma cacao]|nr:hypothetical protein QQP08_017254 [Theobroma cacao]